MKKLILLPIILLFAFLSEAQINDTNLKINVGEIEVSPPQFTGVQNVNVNLNSNSPDLIRSYISENVVYPKKAFNTLCEGTELIRFTVNTDGHLSNFEIINSLCPEIDEEIIRVLKSTNGMWSPGTNNGELVAMETEISTIFAVDKIDYNNIKDYFEEKAKYFFTKGYSKLYIKDNPRVALNYFEEGIKYLPYDKALLLARGTCFYELGDNENALKDWNRIVTLGGIAPDELAFELKNLKDIAELNEIFVD